MNTVKVQFIVSLYLLLFATTQVKEQNELPKASAPSNPRKSSVNYPLVITIPLFGGVAIVVLIALVLFKIKVINSHGFILGFWMLMWFGSTILNSWDIPKVSDLLMYFHIVGNIFGVTYWIRLGVQEYNRKNTWPSANLMFEIGAWFSMFILSCIEIFVFFLVGKKEYHKIANWYPVIIACISMLENYWTKGREIRADRRKSQLVKDVEEAFRDVIRLCMEDPRRVSLEEFDQAVEKFNRLFCILVAQQREAIIVAQQRKASRQQAYAAQQREATTQQTDTAQGAQTSGIYEVQIDEDPPGEIGQQSS